MSESSSKIAESFVPVKPVFEASSEEKEIKSKSTASNVHPHTSHICSICQEGEGEESGSEKTVETPCHHYFHKSCVVELVRPECPNCKSNILDFLVENGVSTKELENRVNQDNFDICCDNIRQMIDVEELSPDECVALALNTFKRNPQQCLYVYRDILLDQIANASSRFAAISHMKFKRGAPGVFMITCAVSEFIEQMFDPQSKSMVGWVPFEQLEDLSELQPESWSAANDLKRRITNPEKQFGVLLCFVNDVACSSSSSSASSPIFLAQRLMSTLQKDKDVFKKKSLESSGGGYVAGIRKSRIAQRDIANSVVHGITCRCSGPSYMSPNREHTWAKNYLKRLMKK